MGREGMRAAAPHGLWALAVLAALGVLSGRAPRTSAGLFCASLAGLHALAPQVYHNNYYVLWLFVLITAPRAHARPNPLGRRGFGDGDRRSCRGWCRRRSR